MTGLVASASTSMALWIVRIVVVMALLCVAAALATPRGRLPLALRGMQKVLRRDKGEQGPATPVEPVRAWRKALALAFVIGAAIAAVA